LEEERRKTLNKQEQMIIKDYEQLIGRISQEIAEQFLALEGNLPQRVVLLDADTAEMTRTIGLETTKRIYETMPQTQAAEKKTTVSRSNGIPQSNLT
jgi:hypothetical protein